MGHCLSSFFCFHQTHDYYASVFTVCVCGCVGGVFVGVYACVGLACLSAL